MNPNGNVSKTRTKFNLGDFDEEINGVNLSKLFMAYGPSSIVEKEMLIRRNKTQAGPRAGGGPLINESQSPSAHHQAPKTAAIMHGEQDFTTDEEDEADFSGFDEPIIIRLMTNMFA